MKKKIIYKRADGTSIKLVFLATFPYRYYKGIGKAFPKTTECHLYMKGTPLLSGEVVKHNSEIDNPNLAARLAAKKAMRAIKSLEIRKELWKLILGKFPINNP